MDDRALANDAVAMETKISELNAELAEVKSDWAAQVVLANARGDELKRRDREILDLEATVGSLNIILGDIYGRAWDGLKEIENG